jgi:calcineurin-like phosphoesterase family protein
MRANYRFRTYDHLTPRWRLVAALLLVLSRLALPFEFARADGDPVLVAAGDIASCNSAGDEATADLLDRIPGTVAALGDELYTGADCYQQSWGRHIGRTRPALGNHEYENRESWYFKTFGTTAGDRGKGYYSYDLGAWHIVVLNSNCTQLGCGRDSVQTRWLRADLAAHPAECTLAYWHHPRFSSDRTYGSSSDTAAFWDALYEHGADVVLSGHAHVYERFAPQTPAATGDPDYGIRQFTVGTGGASHYAIGRARANSEVRNDNTFGVLKLTLHPSSYEWEFVPEAGKSFTDSGTGSCHPSHLAPTTMTIPTSAVLPPVTPVDPAPSVAPAPPVDGVAPAPSPPSTSEPVRSGYWMLGAGGSVFPFGDAGHHGEALSVMAPDIEAVDLESTPSGNGYWIVDGSGRVSTYGDARHLGGIDPSSLLPGESVTSLSATPSGEGYWIFTTRGRAVALGDAPHFGDMSGAQLNGPVIDSIPTPSGQGYYMVASDGGIFTFGDAAFHGSMGDHGLNAPVRSLVPDGDGQGYWMVASDGGIFAFDAPFRGSMGGVTLNRPITGMVRFGDGYLMVGEDGGIFNFSDKPFHGSLGESPPARPIVSVAALEH